MSLRQIFGMLLSALATVATTVAVILGFRIKDKNEEIASQAETIDKLEKTQEYAIKSDVETRQIQEDYNEKIDSLNNSADPVATSLDILRDLKGNSSSRVRPNNR